MSRDATDSGSNTFSRSSNSCSIASIKLYYRNLCDQELCYRYIWQGIPLTYSLNSHCFEEYPHCHNRTRTPFSLLLLASNSSNHIMCTKISSIDHKQSETVYNCVSLSLFPRFCIATRRQQDVTIEKLISYLLRLVCDHQRLVGDERKRCFHFRKLFVMKLLEGACDCLRRSYTDMKTCIWKQQPTSSA